MSSWWSNTADLVSKAGNLTKAVIQDAIVDTTTEVPDPQAELENAQQVINQLQAELRRVNDQQDETAQRLEAVDLQLTQLKEAYRALESEKDSWREKANAAFAISSSSNSASASHHTHDRGFSEDDDMNLDNDQLVLKYKAKLMRADEEIRVLKSQTPSDGLMEHLQSPDKQSEIEESYRNQLAEMQNTYSADMARLRGQYETEIEQLQTELAQKTTVGESTLDVQQQLARLHRENTDLDSKLLELNTSFDEQLGAQAIAYKAQLAKLREEEVRRSDEARAALQRHQVQQEESAVVIQNLRDQLAQALSAPAVHQESIQALQVQLAQCVSRAEYDALQRSHQDLHKELESAQIEKRDLRAQLELLRTQALDESHANQSLQQREFSVTQDLEKCRLEVDKLKLKSTVDERQILALQQQLADLSESDAAAQLQAAQALVSQQQIHITQLESRLEDVNSQSVIAELKVKIEQLEQSTRHPEHESSNSDAVVRDLQTRIEQLQAQSKRLSDEKAHIQDQLDAAEASRAAQLLLAETLKKEVDKLQASSQQTLKDEKSELELTIEQLEWTIAEQREHIEMLSTAANRHQSTLAKVLADHETQLQQLMEENTAQIATFVSDLNQLLQTLQTVIDDVVRQNHQSGYHSKQLDSGVLAQQIVPIVAQDSQLPLDLIVNLATRFVQQTISQIVLKAELDSLLPTIDEQSSQLAYLRSQVDASAAENSKLNSTLRDAEERYLQSETKHAAALSGLHTTIATVTEERNRLQERLQAATTAARQDSASEPPLGAEERARLEGEVEKSHRDLQRLQQHLMELEESSTQEGIIREQRIQVLEQALAQAEATLRERADFERANTETTSRQLSELSVKADRLLSERDALRVSLQDSVRENEQYRQSVTNLQSVLEQFQEDHGMETRILTEKHLKEIEDINRQLQECRQRVERLEAEKSQAIAKASLSQSLQVDLLTRERDLSVVKKECDALREQVARSHDRLKAAARKAAESSVDKSVMKNLLLSYFTSSKRSDVLQLIANVLEFSDAERQRAGVGKSWLTSIVGGGGGAQHGHSNLPTSESLSELFVQFIIDEAQKVEPEVLQVPSSGTATETSAASAPASPLSSP